MRALTHRQLLVRAGTTRGESAVARAMREAVERAASPAPTPDPEPTEERKAVPAHIQRYIEEKGV